ncbi:serine/threonine protein kinase [Ureibacillus massiliensis 4400831 = CIP 108448 = CCUG 49529]|uniref:Serine/threonine-protein kinase PrkC n=1 Tax=Ureibacillus massiliensis 4400831 = CIP 108448 = CCUG 49529 TaxID=1211035 RepID=A0A0A3J512_9BACL|nr:Stk1 family PASTA domain-containing Ser/Thr kinase [Ureibacillus massiliensis]KGR92119.1 serine/threonine protein kinase [Ureibacillus massiliensis 4400831 = CIP 108448 = CCUG 49529]
MLIGKRINDRYKILQYVGGGGMSNVYLAHDIILNRDVAVKVLRYDSSNEEEFHRRFQREALSATSLMHPNIVSIYDVGEDGDMHYIVMEFIKGRTLKQYINEYSPLSPARSVHIMKQLTSAIAHAHENQIIHRDIKPQNILIDEDGNVKITDFGIATTLSETSFTKTNSVLGTVHYISPEQARGGTATKKSDIYALGIVLYELLTGELPFSGESAVSIALKHLQSETPSVRGFDASIPQALENVVYKATAKNPAHRYNTVEEMEADLETVLSPNRLNEPKFVPPIDNEATKAMPAIKESLMINGTSNNKKAQQNEVPNKKDPTPQNGKKKQGKGKIFAIVGASVAILVILAVLLFNILSPKKIEIPDVSNMEIVDAISALEELGFKIGEQREQHSDDIETGKVIGTDPEAGLSRISGTEIDLIISLGTEKKEMENYIGQQISQVSVLLEKSDFKDFEIEEVFSDKPVGEVIEQSPIAGEEIVVKDTVVVLTVSAGKEKIKVTDLTGFNESARNEYARSSGFVITVKGEEHSDDIPVGSVIRQTPEANTELEKGSTIEVIISKGPEEKAVKIYNLNLVIPYNPIEYGAEQRVRVFIQDKNNVMVQPKEEFTITEDYEYHTQLDIEEGQTAAYRIEVDSTVIAEGTIPYNELN